MMRSMRAYGLNILLGGVLLLFSETLIAKRVALLMGVQNYAAPMQQLQGSRNDVLALRDVLISRWGFRQADIVVLLDSEASHAGMKAALDDLVTRTEEGDFVFLYFAGHGTSV